ncbi:glycosyltransferase family 2 protein [Fibrella sp. WM1]|uniref:glycosyltransferase family 2 protein n=1 Tax=Fibrella musci TaxID=3242485 RepID=UPI00352094CE
MVSVIIPTYNASAHLPALLNRLSQQTMAYELIVIDSTSTDETPAILRDHGIDFTSIPTASFNHGATRNLGVQLANHENLVFLTQDALPADATALERLVETMASQDHIAMAYGRQLPYPSADLLSQFARQTNYPATSVMKSLKDIPQMGIKTCHCSNSFAAYKKSALLSVGGFPTDTILGEDVSVAARLILEGKTLAYCAEATVFHSHNYTITEEFKRYFDIGVFHRQQQTVLKPFTQAEAEGVKYVLAEWTYLSQQKRTSLIPVQLMRTVAKYIGYRAGQWHQGLPVSVKRAMSMHRSFWQHQ